MSFDVEMPDGTVIEDVPDGTTQAQVMSRYKGSAAPAVVPKHAPVEPPANAADGQSFAENAALGLARSGYHTAERGGNLALKVFKMLGSKDAADTIAGGGFGSDQDLTNREETDKDLLDTAGGTVGNLVGDVALTAPVGGVGAEMKAAGLAMKGGSKLARTVSGLLKSGIVRGGTEGVIQGAVTGTDDSGAGAGAAAGSILGAAGTAGRKLIDGIVDKSGAANALEAEVAKSGKRIFLPLSLGGSNKGVGNAVVSGGYAHVLDALPGAGEQLQSQGNKALQTIRDIAAEKSAPAGFSATGFANEMDRKLATEEAFDKAYQGTVKKYTFDRPADFRQRVMDRIEKDMPGVDNVTKNKVATLIDSHMERFSSNQPKISGQNLVNARNMSNAEYKGLKGPEREALGHGVKAIDDIVSASAANTTDAVKLADLKAYQGLSDRWKNFIVYSKAVHSARVNGGNFTPAQLAKAAHPVRQEDLYNLGTAGHEVMKGADSQNSRLLNFMRYGTSGAAVLHNPVLATAILGGGNIMATKTVQRALTGDLRAQQTLAQILRGRYAGDVTSGLRRGAVSAMVDE